MAHGGAVEIAKGLYPVQAVVLETPNGHRGEMPRREIAAAPGVEEAGLVNPINALVMHGVVERHIDAYRLSQRGSRVIPDHLAGYMIRSMAGIAVGRQ